MNRSVRRLSLNRVGSEHGQSLVEIAIFLPIFILLIAGIVELGYYLNRYLNLLDASREAARFGADLDPVLNYTPQYNHNSPSYDSAQVYYCSDPDGAGPLTATTEFYTVLACYAQENLPEELDASNGYDDIVISAFTIKNGVVCYGSYRYPLDSSDKGWSLTGNHVSLFPVSRINSMFDDTSPQQGIVVVEIFYQHRQALALPFFTIFVPRDIGIHVYTVMPNPTAGTVDCP